MSKHDRDPASPDFDANAVSHTGLKAMPTENPSAASHLGLGLLARIREERLSVRSYLLPREVLFVRCERPLVTVRILNLTVAVAPELIGHRHFYSCPGLHGAVESSIGVFDVQVERDTRPAAAFWRKAMWWKLIAQHEHRVSDF